MASAPETTFVHPGQAYRLRYPADWECVVKDEGRSCGFGPRGRDDVGLWVTLVATGIDTALFDDTLRTMLEQSLQDRPGALAREDRSLRHRAFTADTVDETRGWQHWIVAGGDLVLLATSEFPIALRDEWEGRLARLMQSLEITRDDAVLATRVTSELLDKLRHRHPNQDFRYDAERGHIVGPDRSIFAGNLIRQVERQPGKQSKLIDAFLDGLAFTGDNAPSLESLAAVRDLILPVLKPESYVEPGQPAAAAVHRRWLGDLVVCYGVSGTRTVRFLLENDVQPWGLAAEALHELALANLSRRPWPELPKKGGNRAGRLLHITSGDGFDASRLLDPRLHDTFAPVLGSPFAAGVPDRDTLLLFSRLDRAIADRVTRQVRADFAQAAYPISPRTFLVGRAGIEVAE